MKLISSIIVMDATELPGVIRQVCTRKYICQPLPPRTIYTARGSISFLPVGAPTRVERD